jgi:hypothetical protein
METILNYLKDFKGKQGLYIIRPKSQEILKLICQKLNYEYTSDIAYIGKASLTPNSDLFKRGKEEMGWSNFDGATYVRKMGRYLDFDIKDKYNIELKEQTKMFICTYFTIECVAFEEWVNILQKETEYIQRYKPCLNDKKKTV